MTITRPLLADTIGDINLLKFPVMVSEKLDGIRCLKVNGKALTRKFKPIPNNFIRNWIEKNLIDGVDGELMIPGKNFNEIQSLVMTEDGEPDFVYHVFDLVTDVKIPFIERHMDLVSYYLLLNKFQKKNIQLVNHTWCRTVEDLLKYEQYCLDNNYEGVMVRSIEGRYKCGRSTLKEGILLKLKRFQDSEAEILGFEELQNNTNAKEINELGLSKRSTKKEGMVGASSLGKFKVRDIKTGTEFELGTGDGLTKELRQEIWNNKDKYLNKIVKYKYQGLGTNLRPRFPVWLGLRDERDM